MWSWVFWTSLLYVFLFFFFVFFFFVFCLLFGLFLIFFLFIFFCLFVCFVSSRSLHLPCISFESLVFFFRFHLSLFFLSPFSPLALFPSFQKKNNNQPIINLSPPANPSFEGRKENTHNWRWLAEQPQEVLSRS